MQREWDCRCQRTPLVVPLPWPSVLVVLGLFWGWDGCWHRPCSGGEGKDQRHLSCSLWLGLTPRRSLGRKGKGGRKRRGKEGWEQRYLERKKRIRTVGEKMGKEGIWLKQKERGGPHPPGPLGTHKSNWGQGSQWGS